jgi:hypothetical protein
MHLPSLGIDNSEKKSITYYKITDPDFLIVNGGQKQTLKQTILIVANVSSHYTLYVCLTTSAATVLPQSSFSCSDRNSIICPINMAAPNIQYEFLKIHSYIEFCYLSE